MSNPIIPIKTIRDVAFKAARSNKPQCPVAFQFVEHVWREQYKLAQHALRCEAVA